VEINSDKIKVSPAVHLPEGSAPSTDTGEGALYVDSADHHLKFRAQTDGAITDLLAGGGGGGATSSAMARVDPSSSDAVDDNDLTTAFLTIQGGIDAIINAGGGTVYIYPKFGGYVETPIIDAPNVHLVGVNSERDPGLGFGARDIYSVKINPSGSVALVVTEATRASVATLIARGTGTATWRSFYDTDLVDAGGATVRDVSITGIDLQGWLCVWGKATNTDFLQSPLQVLDCVLRGSAHLQRANYIEFSRSFLSIAIETYNCYNTLAKRCSVYQLRSFYNAGEISPQYGYFGTTVVWCELWGQLRCSTASNVIIRNSNSSHQFDLESTSSTLMDNVTNSRVPGVPALVAEPSCTWEAHNCYFKGDVSLSSGGGACPASGLEIEGTLTDTANRLSIVRQPWSHGGAWTSRPTTFLYDGRVYFDTALNKPFWYERATATWYDATGTPHP